MSCKNNDIYYEDLAEQIGERTRKRMDYQALGEKLRRMANNMEKVGDIVKIMDDAKKKNPRGLIF